MKLKIIEATPNADEVACRAARGDYREEWVSNDVPFPEIMEPVKGNGLEEKKYNLIKQLIKRGHWGPFEHAGFVVAVKNVSRSCMAQVTRHRHLSFDVQSMRYVTMENASFYMPPSLEDPDGPLTKPMRDYFKDQFERHYDESKSRYKHAVESGMPKEEARMYLPIGTQVNMTISGNLHAFMHVLALRSKGDAQGEIRQLSGMMKQACHAVAPVSFDVFDDELPMRMSP